MEMYRGAFFNKIVPSKSTQRPLLYFFFFLSAALGKKKGADKLSEMSSFYYGKKKISLYNF